MIRLSTLLALSLFSLGPFGVAAQAPFDPAAPDGSEPLTLETLLERTLFRIDVLNLTVRFEGLIADRLRSMARSPDELDEARDSAATLAAGARRADAHLDFLRDVSLDAFLDGIRSNARRAADAEIISRETWRKIDGELRAWYAFLADRGVKEGDRMSYRIRGDTLAIRYRTVGGELLLDRTEVGAEHPRSVLGGYFAPGSEFREGLLASLFDPERAPNH